MNTQEHILHKYNIKTDAIEIPDAGRDELAQLLYELDFKTGVEVGVAAGEYSKTLMENNPQMKLYGVDPYIPYKGYKDYVRTSTFNTLEEDAKARLDMYPNYEFIKDFSVPAAQRFKDGSLDFVYLDANHTEKYVTEDIEVWGPKVRPGGILAGHDYARIRARNGEPSSNWAVIPAVNKYVDKHDIQLFIWGLEAKLKGLKRDPIRSWMVIKA